MNDTAAPTWRERWLGRFGDATREATLLSAGTQLEALFSFVTVVALTRTTSVTRAGEVFFAQALAAVVFLFLDPRLEDSLQRYAALLTERGRDRAATTLFRRCFRLDTAIAIASGALVALVLAVAQPGGHGVFTLEYFSLAIVNALLQAPIGTAMAGFAIAGCLADLARLRIALAIVSSTANVIAIVVGGPTAYLAANAITTGLATVVIAVGAGRRVTRRFGRPAPIPAGSLPGIVNFTVKSSLATSVSFASDQVLYAAAGAAGGAAFLAQMRVATAPGRFVTSAASPVASVLFPRTSTESARGDQDAVRRLQERASVMLAPIAGVISAISFVVMPFLVPLIYGSTYRTVVVETSIFVAAASLRAVVIWSKVLLLAVGRPGLRLVELTIESLLMLGVTVWFAHAHDLLGVAIAQLGIAAVVVAWWLLIIRWQRLLFTPDTAPRAYSADDLRSA